MCVPLALVTWILLVVGAISTSICLDLQLGKTKQFVHHSVTLDDSLDICVQPSAAFRLPCDSDREMVGLTIEQKVVIKNLYKYGKFISLFLFSPFKP